MRTLAIDIETYSSADLAKSGVYAYTQSEDFEILLFGYAFDEESVRVIDLKCGEKLPIEVMEGLTNPEI
jgi:DNA polymerase